MNLIESTHIVIASTIWYNILKLEGREKMEFEIKGLNKLEKKLDELQKNANQISGNNEVPLKDLFSETFMTKYTKFNTINDFFENSSFTVESTEDFDSIPESDLDTYVSNNTLFSSWQDMLNKGVEEWTSKQLGF